MFRETLKARITRLKKIIDALDRTYPEAHCELDHRSPLELLIATILSAQCTDKRVNLVTTGLFKKPRREIPSQMKIIGRDLAYVRISDGEGARLHRLLKKSEKQIPRGLKPARDEKNKSLSVR